MNIITQEAFEQLHYPKEITREMVGYAYCSEMILLNQCPYDSINYCNRCLPYLQELGNDLEGANSNIAVMQWRLKEFAWGDLSVWLGDKKGEPVIRDTFGLPTSESRNPFEQISKRLGAKHEIQTTQG